MNFKNTKWDVSDWTEGQKVKFQEKAFELGFTWGTSDGVLFLDEDYYFLGGISLGYGDEHDKVFFAKHPYTLKTYEDMFPEETTKVKTQKWVTADTSKDYMDMVLDKLTHDKDYKVLEVWYVEESSLLKYGVLNDEGVFSVFHESWFYPSPTREEILPEKQPVIEVEEEDTFEGLVYKDPSYGKDARVYFVLTKSSCSYDQWEYVLDNLPTKHGIKGDKDTTQIRNDGDGNGWFDEDRYEPEDILVTFNDIFIKQGEE